MFSLFTGVCWTRGRRSLRPPGEELGSRPLRSVSTRVTVVSLVTGVSLHSPENTDESTDDDDVSLELEALEPDVQERRFVGVGRNDALRHSDVPDDAELVLFA